MIYKLKFNSPDFFNGRFYLKASYYHLFQAWLRYETMYVHSRIITNVIISTLHKAFGYKVPIRYTFADQL
jgi:hypothetical protein